MLKHIGDGKVVFYGENVIAGDEKPKLLLFCFNPISTINDSRKLKTMIL